MADQRPAPLGVDSFWEHADDTDSAEHPLERELADRLDALARYGRRIAECEELGRDAEVSVLLRQQERERREVERLRAALSWTHTEGSG